MNNNPRAWSDADTATLRKMLGEDGTVAEIAAALRVDTPRIYRRMAFLGLTTTAAARAKSNEIKSVRARRPFKSERKLIRPSVPTIQPSVAAEAAHYLRRIYSNVFHIGRERPERKGWWRVGRLEMLEHEMIVLAERKGFTMQAASCSL